MQDLCGTIASALPTCRRDPHKGNTTYGVAQYQLQGPSPTSSHNPYLLAVLDEYSHFPFAFPCPNNNTATVIIFLEQIYSSCGIPNYIHSDKGTSFISKDLRTYLSQKGIATSCSTPYHPTGNGHVEGFNGILRKVVRFALRYLNLPDNHWELVLSDVLHSLRSVLFPSTNTTPREQFFAFQHHSTHGSKLTS